MNYFAIYSQPNKPESVYKAKDGKLVIECITENNHLIQEGYIEDDWRFIKISKSTFYYWKNKWVK